MMYTFFRLELQGHGPFKWYTEEPPGTPWWMALRQLINMTASGGMTAPESEGCIAVDPAVHVFACNSLTQLSKVFTEEALKYATTTLGFEIKTYYSDVPAAWYSDTQCLLDRRTLRTHP